MSDPGPAVDEQALEQIVPAHRQDRYRLLGWRQRARLRRQVGNRCPVDSPVLKPYRPARGEVMPPELREEAVIVADEELTRIQTDVVVPTAVEDRVTEGEEGEHGTPFSDADVGTQGDAARRLCRSEMTEYRVGGLAGRSRPTQIGSEHPGCRRCLDGGKDRGRFLGSSEVLEHERRSPDGSDWIGDPFSGDVGGGPVDRLEHTRVAPLWIDVGARGDAQAAS